MDDKVGIKGIFTVCTYGAIGELVSVRKFENRIMNEGLKKMLGILNGSVTTDLRLRYFQFGTGTSDPEDKTKTDLVIPVGSKYESTAGAIGSVYPFELTRSVVVGVNAIARPLTVYEIGVFYEPEVNGVLFSRVVIPGGLVFPAGVPNTVGYGLSVT